MDSSRSALMSATLPEKHDRGCQERDAIVVFERRRTNPNVSAKTGRTFLSWDLMEEYGFKDVDGRQPDMRPVYREHVAKAARWEP
jgi:hypothetical protein